MTDPVILAAATAIADLVDASPRAYDLRRSIVFFDAEDENGILAPTRATSFVVDGREWRSVEAHYQAAKHLDDDLREAIRQAPDAIEAKAVSRAVTATAPGMGDHAGPARRIAMLVGILARADADHDFASFLVGTGSTNLVEHHPGDCDARWGARGAPLASGWNLQGRLLMGVRARIAHD